MAQPDTGARERGDRGARSLSLPAGGPTGPVVGEPVVGEPAAGLHMDSDHPEGGHVVRGHADRDHVEGGPVPGEPSRGESPADEHVLAAQKQADGTARDHQEPALPPGQYVPRTLPVLHYGPIPAFHQDTWNLRIFGATESGAEASLRWDDVAALPVSEVTADFHCVTKFTMPAVRWAGILAAEVLNRYPPAAAVTHVMIWADFGYSANIRISDFAAEPTILATHRDGERLSPEHGYPLRLVVPHLYAWKSVKWIRAMEYMTADRRGFWEERGYHNTADPWREQRYSYQELEGEGPPL